jgi:hypothetical protein
LLLLAPPASNWFWGVNGVRSVAAPVALALIVCAALAAALPTLRPGVLPITLAGGLMAVVAFPLRETAHWLADTGVRLGAITMFAYGVDPKPLSIWATQLHANPLDFLVNFLAPSALVRAGVGIEAAVSIVTFMTGLAFIAGAARLVRRLEAPPALRPALTATLVLTGALGLFAGYAESGGLVIAAAAWWWGDLVTPLRGRREALRLAAAWLVLFLCHRIAWLMLAPMLWRLFGPAAEGDRPAAKREAALFTTIAVGVAVASGIASGGSGQVGKDLRDLFSTGIAALRWASPVDVANLLMLIAPLAPLGAWLAAWRGAGATPARTPRGLVWVAALPLIPLAILYPVAPNGLGVQRDWDLSALMGWTLSVAGLLYLLRLPEAALRRALAWVLPGLVLTAGGWLAVHADSAATLRRVEAYVAGPPLPAEPQLGHAWLYLGSWRENHGDRLGAARAYAASYDQVPTPNRGMLAVRMFAEADRFGDARRLIDRIRARGQMDSTTAEVLEDLAAQLDARERAAQP